MDITHMRPGRHSRSLIRRAAAASLVSLLAIGPFAGLRAAQAVTAAPVANAAVAPDTQSFLRRKASPTPTATSAAAEIPTATASATPAPSASATATPSAPSTPSTGGTIAARLAGLKVMNYYPSQNSWANMWSNWNPIVIDTDFGRIAALHANTVRVIIQASTFGYPTPSSDMLSHLSQIIALAQNHGLRVQLTLFDWWNGYTDIAGSQQWARAVLAPYTGDARIAFIELQNEIDPTNTAVLSWAQQMIPFLKSLSGGIPVTVSVSPVAGLSGLRTLVGALQSTPPDFYDCHYYGQAELAYTSLQQAMQIVAPAPLFIGETGFSSATSNTTIGGLPDTTAALEAFQDFFYRSVQGAASSLGLPQAAPWTLSDFVPGSLAWVSSTSAEYNFGLYRADGTAKAVVASVTTAFASGSVDTSFDNGFEQCAGGIPADWRLFHSTQAQFACDSTVAHSGGASARISASSGDSSGVPAFFISPTMAHVNPGQTYTASVWARGQNATGTTQIALAWFDASGNYLGTIGSPALLTGTTTWTQLTVRGTAPAGAAYVQIHCKSAYNSGSAWFDDLSYQ